MSDSQALRKPITVAIGASSGGLEALKKFMGSVPENPGYAIVIVQHLAPDHKSSLAELLSKVSLIPITVVEDHETILLNKAYVIPPGTQLEIIDNQLRLKERDATHGNRYLIDKLFQSMAKDMSSRCIGVILSGSGEDGVFGVREIKAAGGVVLVQEPSTAQNQEMPLNAIKQNTVDKVLPPEAMPELIANYIKHPHTIEPINRDKEKENESSLHEISAVLRHHESFDLRQYKPGTILRRITRRMGLLGIEDYNSYLAHLRQYSEERRNLTKDLMIKVTDFFRDTTAFEVLESKVIEQIINNLRKDEEIRVWVAGCATGEEAYSLAILIREQLKKKNRHNSVRIFATDIDDESIAFARRGLYPSNISQTIPSDYLDRYFIKQSDYRFLIREEIREGISFARQNLTYDPPFSRLHLVSCRNLLIYLKREFQKNVLQNFYFSLLPEGSLFLGTSETISPAEDLFKPISAKWRIYKKQAGADKKVRIYTRLGMHSSPISFEKSLPKRINKGRDRRDSTYQALANIILPPTIVADGDDKILFRHGDLAEFTIVASGIPSLDVYNCLPKNYSSRIRGLIYKVRKSRKTQKFSITHTSSKEKAKTEVIVTVRLMTDYANFDENAIAISFEKEIEQLIANSDEESANNLPTESDSLALELAETKEELQNTIEELETSSEELKAAHEEALSTNEEIQSANEELEASTEELRSLNEELSTTNDQLKEKISDLRQAKDDTKNFFDSTNIATVFVNDRLEIQRFTPAAEELLKLGRNDFGRNLSTLPSPLIDAEIIEASRSVFQKFRPEKFEKSIGEEYHYDCSVTPYRTEDHRVNGIVLVFQDVTELRKLTKRAEFREKQQAALALLSQKALTETDTDSLLQQAVRQVAHVLDIDCCGIFGLDDEANQLKMVAGIGWEPGIVGNLILPNSIHTEVGYSLSQKNPLIVSNLANEKRFEPSSLAVDHNMKSLLSCVINHREPPFGFLGIYSKSEQCFSDDDANFITAICNLLSTALKAKEALENLKQSETRLQIAKDKGKLGVYEWDIINEKIVWDEFNKKIWGLRSKETPTYNDFESGVHPEDIERVNKAIEIAMNDFPNGRYQCHYRVINRLDRKIYWLEASGTVIFENKQPAWFVGMIVDVTEYKELLHKMENLVEQLEEADKKKNNFLSMLGHELRNPIGVVSGCLEDMKEEARVDTMIMSMAERNIDAVTRLLDDLLDLSRISREKIKIKKEQIDLTDLLEDCMYAVEKRFYAKKCKIESTLSDSIVLFADYVRLEQIFSNILNNAFKFSPQKSVIKLTATKSNNFAVIKIKDSGQGIEQKHLEKIFEPFYQENTTASDGLGVGLALVKKLVELHEGRVSAESLGKGEGTTITIELPLIEAITTDVAVQSQAGKDIFQGLKLLLIEDNEELAEITAGALTRRGCEVIVCHDGESGLQTALKEKPQVAIVDIEIPKLSGYEVAEELSARETFPALIALSGFGHQEARDKALASGFIEHFAKPIKFDKLAAAISEGLKNRAIKHHKKF